MSAADILEMVALMRAQGIVSLRTDAIELTLGPAPRPDQPDSEPVPLTEDERTRLINEGEQRAIERIFGSAA